MTTKIINSYKPSEATKLGINQLPALFHNNWLNTFFTDFDKSLPKAFDVPNVHYPYDILVRRTSSKNIPYEYEIQVALAGIKKEEIAIKVVDERLNIEIDPKEETPPSDYLITYLRNGISYRKAALEFSLSKEVDTKNISSSFNNGLLKIRIPIIVPPTNNITINID